MNEEYKIIIQRYPITSAYIGALITISGTQDKTLLDFDQVLREIAVEV